MARAVNTATLLRFFLIWSLKTLSPLPLRASSLSFVNLQERCSYFGVSRGSRADSVRAGPCLWHSPSTLQRLHRIWSVRGTQKMWTILNCYKLAFINRHEFTQNRYLGKIIWNNLSNQTLVTLYILVLITYFYISLIYWHVIIYTQ